MPCLSWRALASFASTEKKRGRDSILRLGILYYSSGVPFYSFIVKVPGTVR